MKLNLISGGWIRNSPWGTEHAFEKGLLRLNHQVNRVMKGGSTSFPDADVNVIFKHVETDFDRDELFHSSLPCIIYQPDDMRFPHIHEEMKSMVDLCVAAVIFEPDGVKTALEMGFPYATRIMLPVDDEIWRPLPVPKVLDACFIANFSNEPCHESRRWARDIINEMGLRSIVMSSFDIPQIVHLYNSSKIVIHHATDVGQGFGFGYGYQSRHFEAGFTGACVLSNAVVNELNIPVMYLYNSPETFRDKIHDILRNEYWRQSGFRLLATMNNFHKSEHRAQELIDFIECLQ